MTDDNQNVTDTFAYTAFGEVTERTGTTEVPFQYIGQKGCYTDGLTGQIMARRRPYEPARARWLSVDPLHVYAAGNSSYQYARNSPIVRIDPSGLLDEQCCCCCAEDVRISKGEDADRVPKIPVIVWGMKFVVTINTSWERQAGGDCTLKWWERAFHPTFPPLQEKDEWYDMHGQHPDILTFEPWRKRDKICGTGETTTIPDYPSVSLRDGMSWTQTIHFVIRVESAEGCPCVSPSITKYAKLYLDTIKGRGSPPRPFFPYEDFPGDKFPDYPPGVP